MRPYKLVCGAAARLLARLFQNLTVLCHQAASRRLTGTFLHKRASGEWGRRVNWGGGTPLTNFHVPHMHARALPLAPPLSIHNSDTTTAVASGHSR